MIIRRHLLRNLSIRSRLLFLYILGPVAVFVVLSLLSYLTISSIYTNRIETSIIDDLRASVKSIDDSIDNLIWVSQQLASDSSSQDLGQLYDYSLDSYYTSSLVARIKEEISILSFSSPKISTINYISLTDSGTIFSSNALSKKFDIRDLKQLVKRNKFTFFGPHRSNSKFNSHEVISVIRPLEGSNTENIAVYVEVDLELDKSGNADGPDNNNGAAFVLYGEDGSLLYNQLSDGTLSGIGPESLGTDNSGTYGEYIWHRTKSNYGYTLMNFIPKAVYNREINNWFSRVLLIFLAFLFISAVTIFLVQRAIFSPLRRFNREIKAIQRGELSKACEKAGIPEFDVLLGELSTMKQNVAELIETRERNEKLNSRREIEKLLYQINPHFLMNTLNTLHWISVKNNQKDIDNVVVALNKLLYYNLKRDNTTTTVKDEIEACKQYAALQQTRYDFRFDIHVDRPTEILDIKIPRFILQPLVENSIHHGLREYGRIEVDFELQDDLKITVKDDGCGIPEKAFQAIAGSIASNNGSEMGIGLNYVNRMIESFYEGKARLVVSSTVNVGTQVTLTIPVKRDGEVSDKGIDR